MMPPSAEPAAPKRGGLVFQSSGQEFFLAADVVLAVLPMPKVQPLPGAPPEVLGFALVEGEAVVLLGVGRQTTHLVLCTQGEGRVGLVGAQVLRTGIFPADPHGPGVLYNGRPVATFDLASLCLAVERGVPSARLSG